LNELQLKLNYNKITFSEESAEEFSDSEIEKFPGFELLFEFQAGRMDLKFVSC